MNKKIKIKKVRCDGCGSLCNWGSLQRVDRFYTMFCPRCIEEKL